MSQQEDDEEENFEDVLRQMRKLNYISYTQNIAKIHVNIKYDCSDWIYVLLTSISK
jgi:hypothetical protein